MAQPPPADDDRAVPPYADAADAPSLGEQAREIATAGVEVAVGLAIEVVQAVRRRLGR